MADPVAAPAPGGTPAARPGGELEPMMSPLPDRLADQRGLGAPPDRSAAPSGAFRVERLDGVEARAHRDAWLDLVGRALEPNAFLDPDFALPAAQHLDPGRRPSFVLVWDEGASGGAALAGICAVAARRGPWGALASAWMHDLATLGFPLLDAARGADALRALLGWAEAGLPRAAGLVLPAVPAAGPTAALLRGAAAERGASLAVLNSWERAALRDGAAARGLSGGGAKELRRQRRRLAERGPLGFASARDGAALHAAVEQFLALEAGGWKGRNGGALLLSPGRAAFARAATRLLARRGLCRVDGLTLGGEVIASAVVLSAGPADFLWKIAYREDLARFSPGVQLVVEVTEAQRRAGRAFTDSCAVPDHPMIGRLWRDRLALCDLAVALRPVASRRFALAVEAARARRRLRAGLKRALEGWRRARRGRPGPA